MEKIDVVKLVRENQEKFKEHLQKMKELEEKEKELNYQHIYKNYNTGNNDRLITIPEGESETISFKKSSKNNIIEERAFNNQLNKARTTNTGIYKEIINDSEEEEEDEGNNKDYNDYKDYKYEKEKERDVMNNKTNARFSDSVNEKLSKEHDYKKIYREEAKNDYRSEEEEEDFQVSEDEEQQAENYRSDEEVNNTSKHSNYEQEGDDNREEQEENNISEDRYKSSEDNFIKQKIQNIYDSDSDSEYNVKKGRKTSENSNDRRANKINPSNNNVITSKKLTPQFSHNNQNPMRSNSTFKSSAQAANGPSNPMNKLTTQKSTDKLLPKNNKTMEKRPYTAYTYSTIKKMKEPNIKEDKKKPVIFTKQYNGKLDRVALYQRTKSFWDKKPYLSNAPLKVTTDTNIAEAISKKLEDKTEKMKIQKLKNIKKPIRHYVKNML